MLVQFDMSWSSMVTEFVDLLLAFVLSAVIGFERQRQLKSAGLRTHTVVGLGSAVFTLVSVYGFDGMGTAAHTDPSRIAAQVVSGIGFLGAGLIFVRQNVVSGLTTAASVWVTAAIGMACGAGLPFLAVVATGFYLLAVTVLPILGRHMPNISHEPVFVVEYKDGQGVLRQILAAASELGYDASLRSTRRMERPEGKPDRVQVVLRFRRMRADSIGDVIRILGDIRGVVRVQEAPESQQE